MNLRFRRNEIKCSGSNCIKKKAENNLKFKNKEKKCWKNPTHTIELNIQIIY